MQIQTNHILLENYQNIVTHKMAIIRNSTNVKQKLGEVVHINCAMKKNHVPLLL